MNFSLLNLRKASAVPTLSLLLILTFGACKKDVKEKIEPEKTPIPAQQIVFSKSRLTLTAGDTTTLKISVLPTTTSDKSLTWSSSDTKVAVVSQQGKVSAVGKGRAFVTAKGAKNELQTSLLVGVDFIFVSEISFATPESIGKLSLGAQQQLVANVFPANADLKTLDWSSSHPEIIEVTADGKLTGIKIGKAIITAKSKDDSNISTTTGVEVVLPPITIQAENFSAGNVGKETNAAYSNGQGIGSVRNGYYTVYGNNKIKLKDYSFVDISAGCNNAGVVIVEVRENSVTGNLLSTITLKKTSGSLVFDTSSAAINLANVTNPDAEVSICLVFKGPNTWMCNADWIKFR